MKKIFVYLLAFAVIGLAASMYLYNKPVASMANKKPALEVSATQLRTDYETDEKTANDRYLGKLVQVNGTVSAIAEEEGKKKVNIDTGSPMSMIICEMENEKGLDQLQAGDEVKVKGICTGYLSDVILSQSSIVSK